MTYVKDGKLFGIVVRYMNGRYRLMKNVIILFEGRISYNKQRLVMKTVKEFIKELEKLPPNKLIALPIPEYWEGDTDYYEPAIDPQGDSDWALIIPGDSG